MSGFLAIYRRELLSLWATPLSWVVLVVFLLLQGTTFYSIVVHFSTANEIVSGAGPVETYFGQESIFLLLSLLLLCPPLTMRLLAEERRSGTIETLLTTPVGPGGVVLGKYFATLSTYCLMWLPTVLYVVVLRSTGAVDWGIVLTSYLGILGVGSSFLAVGVLASAMTESQMVALVLTVLVLFGMFLLGIGEYVFDRGPLHDLAAHVSPVSHMAEFSSGIVDLRRLVFDASVVVASLFIAIRVVDSWRWE
jgi:ABC-2 type transport system permease protein